MSELRLHTLGADPSVQARLTDAGTALRRGAQRSHPLAPEIELTGLRPRLHNLRLRAPSTGPKQ